VSGLSTQLGQRLADLGTKYITAGRQRWNRSEIYDFLIDNEASNLINSGPKLINKKITRTIVANLYRFS